ncbi:hypothetical protein H5P32_20025 [Mycobacterium paraseoulense]|uniref:Uncharacterized protein n=2 Tax=Mycobacterium paraseoulense TaxID=590652 RepID=A0A1X0ICV2_9MYCO|nr:hypothetical protein [Mycobacterium paraseoulense]MCV7396851.1 hypothetical protein [Mycobacterium paraseoulense]ORB43221.1 hypothetical protein BST39_09000 [Mycobacterium paraseoulense]
MVGNEPWRPAGGPAPQPPWANWSPKYVEQPVPRSRPWLAIAVVLTAGLAIAALILARTRPRAPSSSTATTTPTHAPADVAAAQQQLCDMYQLAAKAVQVDTAGTHKALARIATTNGALMLDMAASNPALDANHRDAARALEAACLTMTAKSSYGAATEAAFQSAIDDAIAKDAAMKKVCSGG